MLAFAPSPSVELGGGAIASGRSSAAGEGSAAARPPECRARYSRSRRGAERRRRSTRVLSSTIPHLSAHALQPGKVLHPAGTFLRTCSFSFHLDVLVIGEVECYEASEQRRKPPVPTVGPSFRSLPCWLRRRRLNTSSPAAASGRGCPRPPARKPQRMRMAAAGSPRRLPRYRHAVGRTSCYGCIRMYRNTESWLWRRA